MNERNITRIYRVTVTCRAENNPTSSLHLSSSKDEGSFAASTIFAPEEIKGITTRSRRGLDASNALLEKIDHDLASVGKK